MEISKKELDNGSTFFFSNEEWCLENEVDDLREGEAYFEGPGDHPVTGYKLYFNGTCIAIYKSFPAFRKRLEKLAVRWNLKMQDAPAGYC